MHKPMILRMVEFRKTPDAEPEAAMIVCVHSDTTVNLAVWDSNAVQRSELSVDIAPEATIAEGKSWSWPKRV